MWQSFGLKDTAFYGTTTRPRDPLIHCFEQPGPRVLTFLWLCV
jgi:hypothetical protein